jgi:hypothetical protein
MTHRLYDGQALPSWILAYRIYHNLGSLVAIVSSTLSLGALRDLATMERDKLKSC